jgi:hypothetical protein
VTREALEALVKRWHWFRYRRALDRMTSMDQFTSLMDRLKDPIFKQYEQWDSIALRRQELRAVLERVGADIRGRSFLDIGPGFGSTLDAVRELGAGSVEFAEYNPFFYTYNRLRGFTGYPLDARKELGKLSSRKYDFLWIKQTFVADRFMSQDRAFVGRVLVRYPKLEGLLDQLQSLAAAGGWVVFCPHWQSDNGKRRVADVLQSPVARICRERGYEALRHVEGHNREPMSPITFCKRVPGRV